MEEQEKLKTKIFKQVAWKERMYDAKEGKKQEDKLLLEQPVRNGDDSLRAIMPAGNKYGAEGSNEEAVMIGKGKLSNDRRILFKRLLQKKSTEWTWWEGVWIWCAADVSDSGCYQKFAYWEQVADRAV